MLFRRSYCIFFTVLTLSCTNEDQSSIKMNDAITSIEGVKAVIAKINFVVELPNGQVVNFNPGGRFVNFNFSNYTLPDNGFNFSRPNRPLVIQGSDNSSASLTIGNELFQFPITFCFSIDELGEIFGIIVDPIFNDFEAYFAISSDDYSSVEVINFDPIGVDDFLFFFVDKNEFDISSGGDGEFYDREGREFLLFGNYQASSTGIASQGQAYLDDFNFTFAGDFSAEIDCY